MKHIVSSKIRFRPGFGSKNDYIFEFIKRNCIAAFIAMVLHSWPSWQGTSSLQLLRLAVRWAHRSALEAAISCLLILLSSGAISAAYCVRRRQHRLLLWGERLVSDWSWPFCFGVILFVGWSFMRWRQLHLLAESWRCLGSYSLWCDVPFGQRRCRRTRWCWQHFGYFLMICWDWQLTWYSGPGYLLC